MRPLIAFAILAPITTAALFGWQVAGYVVSLGSLAAGVAWLIWPMATGRRCRPSATPILRSSPIPILLR